jgi:D-alanyl-D-alanine carboxypeptidase
MSINRARIKKEK